VGGVESDGKTPESNFTHAQWRTLEAVVKDQKKMHPDAKVLGHRDLPNVNKACPSFDALAWWAEVSA
jgi:N-acetylmuramoyl-L-alanine amidase